MVRVILLLVVVANTFSMATEPVSLLIQRGDKIINVGNDNEIDVFPDDKLKISCAKNFLTFCKKSDGEPVKIQTVPKLLITEIPLGHIKKPQLWFGVLTRGRIFGEKLETVKKECRNRFLKFSPKFTNNKYESVQKKFMHIIVNRVKVIKDDDEKKVVFIKVFEAKLYVHISKLYAVLDQSEDSLSIQMVNYQKDSFAYVYGVRNKKIEILFPEDNSHNPTPYQEQLFLGDIKVHKEPYYLLFFHKKQHRSKHVLQKYLQELNDKDFESLFSEGEFISQRTGSEIMAIKNKKQILLELEDLVAFKIKKHKLAGR